MKSLLFFILSFTLWTHLGFADEANQCLLRKKEERSPPPPQMAALDLCVQKNNCTEKQKRELCPWAKEKKNTSSERNKEANSEIIDNISEQCRQLGVVACSLDVRTAVKKIERFNEVFLSAGAEAKPLIFGFSSPSYERNNLNITSNLEKLEADRQSYLVELKNLSNDLQALSKDVATEDEVREKIVKARNTIDAFDVKWGMHGNSVREMRELVMRAGSILSDWYGRLSSLKEDQSCTKIIPEIEKGIADSSLLVKAFAEALSTLQRIEIQKNTKGLRIFTESAIKLRYLATSKSSLQDLEKSIGGVLKLDFDISEANRWWFTTSSDGLVGGLHTRYFQYREPLRLLYLETGKGEEFIQQFLTNTDAPKASIEAAIKVQKNRLKEIQSDIKWLEERGWKGQFADQKITAKMWIEDTGSEICRDALQTFMKAANKVHDQQFQFEQYAEPAFIEAVKICEAVK